MTRLRHVARHDFLIETQEKMTASIGLFTREFFLFQRDRCNDTADILATRIVTVSEWADRNSGQFTKQQTKAVDACLRELRRQLQIAQNNATAYSQHACLLLAAFGSVEASHGTPRQPADEKESTASDQTH